MMSRPLRSSIILEVPTSKAMYVGSLSEVYVLSDALHKFTQPNDTIATSNWVNLFGVVFSLVVTNLSMLQADGGS